ncbi:phage holin family protein [Lysinibacillus agricola]|uniref:Phage holin family protein n=1 Tax=Lysinibacillus agricola TaxID=2590012 RepID=A0ABX7AKR1_9BACI|nr:MULTISPECIES: phage holin family protein [Lysinibacillus]KOS64612.1 holin [Lysinibacillus sp. FJAT-14222]QQP10403.1 phage holin family protein [Lysinibacillus agricola]
MEFLYDYIIEQALIVVPVLLVIGQVLKNTPKMLDWLIPYILLFLGVLFTIGIMGINMPAIVQGILVSGAAVFANQLYKQYSSKDGGNK